MNTFTIGPHIFDYDILKGVVVRLDEKVDAPVPMDFISAPDNSGDQSIYLEDASGKQFEVKLSSLDIECIKGHQVSFLWVQKRGLDDGEYITVKNETLGRWYLSQQIENQFQVEDDTTEKFMPYIYVATSIGIALAAYFLTNSDTAAVVTFLVLAIFCALNWRSRRDKKREAKIHELHFRHKISVLLDY